MPTATMQKQNPSGTDAGKAETLGGQARQIPESASLLKQLDGAIKTASKPKPEATIAAKKRQILERCGCL